MTDPHPQRPGAGPVGPYAFVFWNDDLDDDVVLAQLREIADAGFVGVTLSARVGLSRRVGYLTDEFLRLVRVAVDECAQLGLAVMLYDEASYPSGSANGAVVARDPAFAARCLVPVTHDVDVQVGAPTGDPADAGYWRPALGRDLDARLLTVVARRVDGADDDAVLLPVRAPGLVRLDLPPGAWRVTAVFDAASGGTIRGAHAEQDDGSALAPPAADLLNPDAVAAFLELTHDAYAGALGEHLGTTVVAMFTDEPFLLGRGHRPLARPYTPGLETVVAAALGISEADVLRRLPGLWDGEGTRPGGTDPDATGFVRDWDDAVRARLHRVYYDAQAAWCAAHGLALTGHPAEPDDLGTAARLHWPGQDTVWRWVLPGDDAATSGLDGPESTAPKVAASAARSRGGVPAVTEVLGAYGWRLSLDEARWLLDWYLSRGVTTPVLHAFFSSVRGGRAFESEPDLGPWNSWWPHLPPLVRYVRRVAQLLDAAPPVWPVGVLSRADAAPSGPVVRALLEAQVDFGYADRDDERAAAGYAVLLDPADGVPDVVTLKEHLRAAGAPVVEAEPAAPDLRAVLLSRGAGTSSSTRARRRSAPGCGCRPCPTTRAGGTRSPTPGTPSSATTTAACSWSWRVAAPWPWSRPPGTPSRRSARRRGAASRSPAGAARSSAWSAPRTRSRTAPPTSCPRSCGSATGPTCPACAGSPGPCATRPRWTCRTARSRHASTWARWGTPPR
ncbi:hypothetical protein [Isoptericola sp. NPDC060257]|uniref:hypothetical protein n=1 Tax=Isoptericola sp. NPDC060257 TaxID=3347087 RepID=UPI0036660183